MFERYTEKARRTIFFARYEASQMGSRYIEPGHLLLGLLREDRAFRDKLPAGAAEQVRQRIEERVPQPAERVSTSVDMPLDQDAKRAVTYASEESQAFGHSFIDCWHLILGLLRIETSMAATLLREFGIEYARFREAPAEFTTAAPRKSIPSKTGPLGTAAASLRVLLMRATTHLEERGAARMKRAPWTRKEALGHLIDWAAAHQQWFARALTEPKVTAASYPADAWLAAQQYNDVPWQELLEAWSSLNGLLTHVISQIPEEKLTIPCQIGVADPIPLRELVRRYVSHCEDIVGQLLMRD
jgi:Clp amino terminal domain, pathogenicity island component